MQFLIICALALAVAYGLPGKELKAHNIVLPAGSPEGRVTKAKLAYPGQFPYQVGVRIYKNSGRVSWCGGTLISHTEVLTAAHCTYDAYKFYVFLGSTKRLHGETKHKALFNRDVFVHPNYDSKSMENDISIIRIPYTKYTKNIQPAYLPTKESAHNSFVGENVVASGWGRTSDSTAEVSADLRYAFFNIMPNVVCARYFRDPIFPSNICIRTYNGVSTCKGDSGGPLVLSSNWTLIGIASFGSDEGCQKNFPEVFTRVSSYLAWIHQCMSWLNGLEV